MFTTGQRVVKMPKRLNPFGDASPLQYKSHIRTKEVDLGVNSNQNMKCVYGNGHSMNQ